MENQELEIVIAKEQNVRNAERNHLREVVDSSGSLERSEIGKGMEFGMGSERNEVRWLFMLWRQ